jgi:WD40 repeat protein
MATASATGLVTLSRTGLIFESPPDTAGGARSADSSVGLVKRFDDVRTPLTSLHFHPSEPVIVTTAADGWLRFMDQSRTPERLIAASVRDSHPLITAVSHPSGDWVLVAAHHPLPRLYDAATLTPHVLLGGPAAARRAQLEAAGVTTAAAVPGALAAAVDADAGALFSSAADVDLAALGLHTRPITSLAYSPLGDLFASASADGYVNLRVFFSSLPYTSTYVSLYMSNGSFSALRLFLCVMTFFSHLCSSVRVWDTVSGALVHAFSRAHLGGAGSVAFAPSGKFILTAGADGTAKVFDLRTMTQSVVMQAGAPATPSDPRSGHWPTYGSAAFAASADHVLVACQASGGSVSVHDIVAGGRHVATVPNLHPAGRLLTVTQCPGKSMFVTTGGGDGRAVVCALDGE